MGRFRLVFRLALLAACLLLAIGTAIWLRGQHVIRREAGPEYEREAVMIGAVLARRIGLADEAGTPDAVPGGVAQLFQPVLASHPDLRFLVLADPTGRILRSDGPASDRFARALADRSVVLDLNSTAVSRIGEATLSRLGTLSSVAVPVRAKGKVVAWMNVGVELGSVDRAMRETRRDMSVVGLVALLAVVTLIAASIERAVAAPARLIADLAESARAGGWSLRLAIPGQDDVGQFLASFNAVLRRIADHRERLRRKAEAVAQANPALARRLARIVGAVAHRGDAGRILALPPDGRPALFFLAWAAQLPAAFLPIYAGTLDRPAWGFGAGLAAALPIAAVFLGYGLGALSFGMVQRRWGRRRSLVGAVCFAVLGSVMSALAASLPLLVVWRLISGLGQALAFQSCQSGSQRARRGSRAGCAAGAVCGMAVGGILADRLGGPAVFLVAAVLELVALRLGFDAASQPAEADALVQAPGLGAGVIGQVALSGIVLYLAPLVLTQSRLPSGDIGRILALYPLVLLGVALLGWRGPRRVGPGLIAGVVAPLAVALVATLADPTGILLGGGVACALATLGAALWRRVPR